MLQRPNADEHTPYFATYTSLVPDGDVRDHLRAQMHEMVVLMSGLSDEQANRSYAPGKWTLKESIVHVIDAERVFAYRMLRIGRGDTTPLASFDQDAWVPVSAATERTVPSLVLEYCAVRSATLALMDSFEPAAWARRGTASDKVVSARALAYIIAGHDRHHQTLIREKYLAA